MGGDAREAAIAEGHAAGHYGPGSNVSISTRSRAAPLYRGDPSSRILCTSDFSVLTILLLPTLNVATVKLRCS